ncbi:MAG: hypothetical protein JW928_08410, partial [Candidatus Aureabacteria bacterium]|nr:hypothetical protein [Candidatus Auribacterota bacterium]
MKNKRHLLISIIVHAAVIGLIVFIPSCPRKQEVEIIENVKIVPQAPSVEVKQPEPEEPVKKPEPKPEPELVKKKRTVPKYTPDELKKRLEEKLKETPEEPEKPVKTPEAQSSKTE